MEATMLIISILSLIVAILTLICTWYFWRRSYKEWKTIRELKNIDFSQEGSFSSMSRLYRELRKNGIRIPNPYSDNPFLSVIYNMLENEYKEDT
jgi:hypothetical protein